MANDTESDRDTKQLNAIVKQVFSSDETDISRSGLQDLQANTDRFTSTLGDINPDTQPTVPGTGGQVNLSNVVDEAIKRVNERNAFKEPNITHVSTNPSPFDQTIKPARGETDLTPDRGDRVDFFSGEEIKGANDISGDLDFGDVDANRGAFGNESQLDAYEEYINSGTANTAGRPTKESHGGPTSSVIGIEATFNHINNFIDLIKRDLVLNIYPQLVYKTPIDTGTARKGWQVANSETGIMHVPYATYEEMHGHKPYVENVPEHIFDEDTIIIGNSVNWIMDLEHGNSQQNSYFIESTVLKVVADLS